MLPDSIPESLWKEYKKMRKLIKHPMTPHAETLIIMKLEKWRLEHGASPVDVLNESIEKSWRGVFLNGHGKINGASDSQMRVASGSDNRSAPICSLCQASLASGWVNSRFGKVCGRCR